MKKKKDKDHKYMYNYFKKMSSTKIKVVDKGVVFFFKSTFPSLTIFNNEMCT